ncbi:MAG TPA: alpha/beta hydrolase [Dehalococcoidia bacterium]|nr:alpha/beta hydrolase [Dehalococcoidia bacterium]
MPTVRVRGIDIYYEEHGEGPDLVVAHGLLGSIAALPQFGERLEDIAARGVHVVAYDARGHGRSGYTTARADYAWTALAEDMRALMRALGIERAAIYGGSMGAGTALLLALAHPEAVDRLILRAPPGFGAEARPARRMFSGALATMYKLLGVRMTAAIVAALPAKRAGDASQRRRLRVLLASQRRAAIVPAIRGLLGGAPIPVERLAEIACPALILTHPVDPIHPLSSGEILHQQMPHAKLAVAPSPTYWEEHPEALTHVVAAYVRGDTIAEGLPPGSAHRHVPA